MKINCDQVDNKLIDYIEGALDTNERQSIENHLKTCAECKSIYRQQLAWLESLPLLKMHEAEERKVSPDLNQRIMKAVRQEKATLNKPDKEKIRWFRQRPAWKSIAATAAALVLLIGGIQVVSHLYDQTMTRTTRPQTSLEQQGVVDIASREGDNNYQETGAAGGDETSPAVLSTSQWKLYSGSMASMPVAGEMFADDAALESDFRTPPEKENAEMYAAFELFSQAEAVRVLYSEGPPAKIMFLVLWSQDEVESRAEQLKDSFRPCIYPYSIEIIESDEMTWLLNELGPELFQQVTDELDLSQGSLIKILIEE